MMHDGLHPTVRGYQVWADALTPIFTELLGAPAKDGMLHALNTVFLESKSNAPNNCTAYFRTFQNYSAFGQRPPLAYRLRFPTST